LRVLFCAVLNILTGSLIVQAIAEISQTFLPVRSLTQNRPSSQGTGSLLQPGRCLDLYKKMVWKGIRNQRGCPTP